VVDYFSTAGSKEWRWTFARGHGQRIPSSGTWEFENLSSQLFRVILRVENGVVWAEKFRIIDQNHIHNLDMNYVAERVG